MTLNYMIQNKLSVSDKNTRNHRAEYVCVCIIIYIYIYIYTLAYVEKNVENKQGEYFLGINL